MLEHDGRAYLSVFVGLNSFVFLRSTFAYCGHSPLSLFLPLAHLHKVYTNALEPYQAHLTEASSALAPAFSFEAMSNPGAGAVDVTAQGISSGQRERGWVGGLGVSALQRGSGSVGGWVVWVCRRRCTGLCYVLSSFSFPPPPSLSVVSGSSLTAPDYMTGGQLLSAVQRWCPVEQVCIGFV